jgi:hypothetical protein
MTPSKGLGWAYAMLAIEVAEALGLSEAALSSGSPYVKALWVLVIVTAILQVAGIVCVRKGRVRLGGILQIVGSAPHAVKLDGIIGIIGGARALRYAPEAPLMIR